RAWQKYHQPNLFPRAVARPFRSTLQSCILLGTDQEGGMSPHSAQKHSMSGNGFPVETRGHSDLADILAFREIAASARHRREPQQDRRTFHGAHPAIPRAEMSGSKAQGLPIVVY